MLDAELARRGVRISSDSREASPVSVTPRPPDGCWAAGRRVNSLIDALRDDFGRRTRTLEAETIELRADCKRMAGELTRKDDELRRCRPRLDLSDATAQIGAEWPAAEWRAFLGPGM